MQPDLIPPFPGSFPDSSPWPAIGLRPRPAGVMHYRAAMLIAASRIASAVNGPVQMQQAAALLDQVLEEMPLQAVFRKQALALQANLL